jgi:hypothetical protein
MNSFHGLEEHAYFINLFKIFGGPNLVITFTKLTSRVIKKNLNTNS